MEYNFLKLADLKNRARRIAREEQLARHAALDEAARRGGFQNYVHAQRQLPDDGEPPRHAVRVEQQWWEREPRRFGTAAATLALRSPLGELVKPHQLVEYLGGCKIEGEILVSDGSRRDQRDSQHDVGRLARALQFMDVTGLKPSRARQCYPKGEWDNRPPIADHDSCWFDPVARVHILMTQPYPGRELRRRDDHAAWEARHGWATIQTGWGSIYGFGTELYLLCPKAYAATLAEKLAALERSRAAVEDEAIDPGVRSEARAAA